MADAELDAARRVFAGLIGLLAGSVLIASVGQGAVTLDGGRPQLWGLVILEGRLR
jgi:hypothetical protein